MKQKKAKIVCGNVLADISKEKLGKIIEEVVQEGMDSLDKTLEKFNTLVFLDYAGKHESRYVEIRRV